MPNLFDYLSWRGDLPLNEAPFNVVDALILSTLSYISFDGILSPHPDAGVALRDAAKAFLSLPRHREQVRVKADYDLLSAAADTLRFGSLRLTDYQSVLDMEREMQFAALACHLGDGTTALIFRGTDRALIGWKEDFNMAFRQSIPAQHEALRYTVEFAGSCGLPLRLMGHSKGGNLAVYAAANSGTNLQDRILEVYNQDGPGFLENITQSQGYRRILPKIKSYIPQSSVIGLLLSNEAPYTLVKSRQVGLLQHDPYSWEVMGGDFVQAERLSESSHILDRSLKSWLADMDMEERNELVDAIYEAITAGGASQYEELILPKHVHSFIRTISKDESKRKIVTEKMERLLRAVRNTRISHEKE